MSNLNPQQFSLSPQQVKGIERVRDQLRGGPVEQEGGQCAFVSEVLARRHKSWDAHGGYLMSKDNRVIGDHVWNYHRPSGTIIDATADQHKEGHSVRVLNPGHPEYSRYRFAESEEEDERMFNEARENRRKHGDFWWNK